jgi:4-nitrophenyl phosphatase
MKLSHFEKIASGELLQEDVGAVVVGMDLKFNYLKLCYATHYINRGALFIATNTDSTFPIFNTVFPAAGFISAAITHTLGVQPQIMGKPSQLMMDVVKRRYDLNLERTCMVGDRLDTDIRFGIEGGLGGTLLVLTGVCGRKNLEREKLWVPSAFVERFSDLNTGC